MKEKVFVINIDNCVRCHSCEVACREEHGLSLVSGAKRCEVITIGPRLVGNELTMDFVPMLCFQCEEAFCLYSCPVNAISKRLDGVIAIDKGLCIGCKICTGACPYGNMYFNEMENVPEKCDQCSERTARGSEPACVQHCIGGALWYIDRDKLEDMDCGKHWATFGTVKYFSHKWRLNF